MYDRALGYKTMGCLGSAIAVFAFFAYLLQTAQDMADKVNKAPSPTEQTAVEVKIDSIQPRRVSTGADDKDSSTMEVINAARLSSLLSTIRLYAKDHQGMLPSMDNPEALRVALSPKYIRGEGVFQTPRDQMAYLPNPEISGKPLKSLLKPGEIIALYEPLEPTREKRRAVIYLDGTLRRVTPPEWEILRKKAGIP